MPLGEKIIVGTGIQIVASMSVEGVPGFIDRKLDELAEAIVDIQEFLNGDAE
jgi:prefoldin subunit 5